MGARIYTRSVRAAALALAIATLTFLPTRMAVAQSVVADLSSREIAITTGFTGAELLLFGATEGFGDIVVTVSGPERPEIVRRKERVAGIWVNGASVTFRTAPAYYRVASSKPLERVTSFDERRRLRIGIDTLPIDTASSKPAGEVAKFKTALFRNKQRLGLYGDDVSPIRIMGGRLFRTTISFPANVPTGEYMATVYLFNEGKLVSRESTPLTVRKDGIEAKIYSFAHDHAAWYGAIAILLALMAGWLAGVIFRRG